MTDKEIILDFLESNYSIMLIDGGFNIFDGGRIVKVKDDLIKELKLVFSDFISDDRKSSFNYIKFFNQWVLSKKEKLAKKLNDFLNTLNYKIGSVKLFIQFNEEDKKSEIDAHHALIFLVEKYKTNFFNDFLDEIISNFKRNQGFKVLLKPLLERMSVELPEVYAYGYNFLNDWYNTNVLSTNLDEIFNQLIIRLGETNWEVFWIGHGRFTPKSFEKAFPFEGEKQYEWMVKQYDIWYEKNIIEASENLLISSSEANYNGVFPTLSTPRLD